MIYVDLAIKSLLIGALGWIAAAILRKSSASTRHAVLVATLIGVCLLPVTAILLPRWQVPFLRVSQEVVVDRTPAPATSTVAERKMDSIPAQPAPLNPATAGLIAWTGIACVLALTVLVRLFRLGRMERRLPMMADPSLQAFVSDQCRRSGRHVLLLEGAPTEPPMVWGYSRPVLLLPCHATTWPEDRLHSVVLHELAHIERKDWIASIFAQLACAAFWFNPFMWMILKRLDVESETAADDRVLGMGVPATNYASHLLDISKELRGSLASPRVTLAMARPGKLDRRVRSILEERRCRKATRGAVTLGLISLVGLVAAGIGAAGPTVVRKFRFVDSSPDVAVDVRPVQGSQYELSDEPSKAEIDAVLKASNRTREIDEKKLESFLKEQRKLSLNTPKSGKVDLRWNSPAQRQEGNIPPPGANSTITITGDSTPVPPASKRTTASSSDDDQIFDSREFGEEMKDLNDETRKSIAEAMKDMKDLKNLKDLNLKDLKELKALPINLDLLIGTATTAAMKSTKSIAAATMQLKDKKVQEAIKQVTAEMKKIHVAPIPKGKAPCNTH